MKCIETHTQVYQNGNWELRVSKSELDGLGGDQRALIGSTCDGGHRILTTSSVSGSFLFNEDEEDDLEMFPGR